MSGLPIITRHSLVRAKGEVFVLLYVFFVRSTISRQPAGRFTRKFACVHAGVLWLRMCLLPFWGLAALVGAEKREIKFSLLWESMRNFCILVVFERYLSNAWTPYFIHVWTLSADVPLSPRPLEGVKNSKNGGWSHSCIG